MSAEISNEERIFESARLIHDRRARELFLAEQCAGDTNLHSRLEALLLADSEAESFFHESAESVAQSALLLAIPEQAGDRIGRYRLLEQLGEGGAGLVYMAEQEQPVRRRVALKIIKLGMDTRSVIARFDAERQALALMDHPNIAKVFDGGATDTGRPFFVMELVRGLKITDFCAENGLSIVDRLELFIEVCHAVQHAHQKGIIHRDLKPSNILVTLNDGVAVPKIIDFGIAKAIQGRLTDATLFTAFSQILGTPAYMSPEQALMTSLDVDTRSDIYSLGVLLYELLTGRTPFDPQAMLASGLDVLRKTICEQEPERPSTRLTKISGERATQRSFRPTKSPAPQVGEVKGDLDWIVMKCLEKDRARRYQTANALAMDIRCFLRNEPISARPAGRLYQTHKFIKRHKLPVAAATALTLTVLVGSFLTTREALRAQRAEKQQAALKSRAELEAQRAIKAESSMREKLWQSYLTEAIALRGSRRPGRRFTALELLRKASDIRPAIELRNAAIAAMPLQDIKLNREIDTRPSHLGLVRVGPSCKHYALLDEGMTITVRDLRNNHDVAVFPFSNAKVGAFAFSPDSSLLAASFQTNNAFRLRVYDIGQQRLVIEFPITSDNFAFFPDSDRLFFLSEGNAICSRHVRNGAEAELLAPDKDVDAVALSFDGKMLAYAVAGQPEIRLWQLDERRALSPMPQPAPIKALEWNAEGTVLAAICLDNRILLWDPVAGSLRGALVGHQSRPISLSFSHNGEILATTGWDGTVRLWNVQNATEFFRCPTFSYGAWFDPMDTSFMMLTAEEKLGIFDLALGHECRTMRYSDPAATESWSVAFTPDGRTLITPHMGGVRAWNVEKAAIEQMYNVGPTRTTLSSFNGNSVMTVGPQGINRWRSDLTAEEPLAVKSEHFNWQPDLMPLATIDASGEIVCAIREGKACLFDLRQRSEITAFEAAQPVSFAALSPSGARLAAGDWKSGITIFNVPDHVMLTNLSATAHAMSFSPDNSRLAVAGYKEYALWDTMKWTRAWSIPRNETGYYIRGALAFSFDSRILAISQGPLVSLLDAATGRELATLEAPEEANISALAFTRDTGMLAVCKWNRTIDLWDLRLIRQQLAAMNLDWK